MVTEEKKLFPLIGVPLAIFAGAVLLIWGFMSSGEFSLGKSGAFYAVTNRDFSLFLWQNLEKGDVRLFHETALLQENVDRQVQASPDILAQYHVWQGLLGDILIPRKIPLEEFRSFLAFAIEWLPENWEKASFEYRSFAKDLPKCPFQQLEPLPFDTIPMQVRMAFYGWKNAFLEREAILKFQPSREQVQAFLKRYPQYARHYWRNFFPGYLQGVFSGFETMPYFLRSALFNFVMQQSERLDVDESVGFLGKAWADR